MLPVTAASRSLLAFCSQQCTDLVCASGANHGMCTCVCTYVCTGAVCGVCARSPDDAVHHRSAVCAGGESGQPRDHRAACIPPPPCTVCHTVHNVVERSLVFICFHTWCVQLLPHMVCGPASVYGVCTCFHIWCVHLLPYMVCA